MKFLFLILVPVLLVSCGKKQQIKQMTQLEKNAITRENVDRSDRGNQHLFDDLDKEVKGR